jgi:hypothetical protein
VFSKMRTVFLWIIMWIFNMAGEPEILELVQEKQEGSTKLFS